MRINLIVIRTDNPEKLSEFYEQLGIEFEYHQHGKGTWHYSAKIGEIIFEIYPLMKNQEVSEKSLRLGFTIENLDQMIHDLKERNVEIVKEPKESEWGYFAIIKDLDGRKIELKNKPVGNKVHTIIAGIR